MHRRQQQIAAATAAKQPDYSQLATILRPAAGTEFSHGDRRRRRSDRWRAGAPRPAAPPSRRPRFPRGLPIAASAGRHRLPRFLWVVALGNLVVGTGGFMIGGIVEPLARSLQVSVATAGQLMTVYAIANAVAAPVLLAMAARIDARSVLVGAMLLLAIANAASALAATWGELAAARVLMACAAGLYTPTAAALAVALVTPAQRGRALSVTFSGIGLSYIVGLPFGAWAGVSRFGWPLAFGVVAAAALGVALLLSRAPRGVPTAPASMAGYLGLLRNPRTLGALGVTGLYFATIFSLFSYVGAFLREYVGLAPEQVAPVLMAFGVAALAGTFGGGILADRIGPTRVLYAICAAFLAVFGVLAWRPGHMSVSVVVFIAWGTIGFAFYAAQQSRLVALAPQAATALLGLNASMIYLGTAAGAALGGTVIASAGYRGLPLAAGALIVAVAALVRVTEGRPGRPA
jgi:DHA1 family inner membrane transport protein